MILQRAKNISKKLLPGKIKEKFKSIALNFRIKQVQLNHHKALKKIRKKEKIKVAFFLIHDSVWKYEGVYHLMEKDNRFDPVVIVCPYTAFGAASMLHEMNQAYTSFIDKGYNVLKTYNEESNTWLDVKNEVHPDIVFFTNPHKLTKDEYCITHYSDCLTCYAPYNFGNSHLYQMMHNQLFHNYLWRLFAETNFHKDLSLKYAQNKGTNILVTGFPGTDVFLDHNYVPANVWKQKNENIKKIIWAPHHSIENDTAFLSYSSFLMYADFMVRMTGEFNGKIQVAFKPHPILINKLYEHPDWGKDKTDAYYAQWKNIGNGQLVDGDYVDLFLTSDAMMHDSGSFLIEYLYAGKPVLHLNRDENITDRMNAFGILAYNQHYHAKNETQIKEFIEDVINNIDNKKADRETFLVSELLPPNHKSASENIFEEIVKQVF